jgi:CHAT domain-containing protein
VQSAAERAARGAGVLPVTARRWWIAGLALALAGFTGCSEPPPDAYVSGAASGTAAAVPVGANQVGEACSYQPAPAGEFGVGGQRAVAIRCGSWDQPSGRVFELSGGDAASLRQAATSGPWRTYIDQRFACGAPTETRLAGGEPALLMQCTRRAGGWPHVALTAAAGGRIYGADGVRPALPAIEATLAALNGQAPSRGGGAMSEAEQLISARSTGAAFGSGDEGRYYELTRLGDAYNNVDDPAHAEQAFREALAVQQKHLSADNPGLALTMMKLAAQIAHQRNAPEADQLLDKAAALTARANDPLLTAQLQYYRAVTAAYQGNTAVAQQQAQLAEQSFTRLLPSDAGGRLTASAGSAPRSRGFDFSALTAETARTATETTAITGLAETLRLRAGLARVAGNIPQSTALAERAENVLRSYGLGVSSTAARSLRLIASNEASIGDYSAAESYSAQANRVFGRVVPGERPYAVTALQGGAYRLKQGDTAGALAMFEKAGDILSKFGPSQGVLPGQILPWLDALYDEAERNPAERASDYAKMFRASQLAKGALTAQSIAQASARLAASDPKIAAALRDLQDKQRELDALAAERDRLVAEGGKARDRLDQIDAQIDQVQKAAADAEAGVQAAAPSYRRTIQEPVTDTELRALLQPDEVLLSIFVAPDGAYGFVLQRDMTSVYRIGLNQAQIAELVARLRDTSLPKAVSGQVMLPNYDIAAAYRLYAALIGPAAQELQGKSRVTIAANGALLTFPMGALVTAPGVAVSDGDYRRTPFLLRQFALSYVPAPRTFVDLRRIKAAAPGGRPFIGFGDFRPATDRQIAALFPPERCAQDNRLMHLLGPLPGTGAEVQTVGRELGAASGDIVLGGAFTKAQLVGRDLTPYRIVHLATHALLPTELGQCQTDPAILTSVPANAPSAAAGFLGVDDIENLKLNADLVVLSACDTAGPANGAGESLSGLAQAFFRAGTRGMLVTQWAAADVAAMRLMTGTLAPQSGGMPGDTASALRAAQLRMIDSAGSGADSPMLMSAPYAWAPFVLIGDGVRGRSPGA